MCFDNYQKLIEKQYNFTMKYYFLIFIFCGYFLHAFGHQEYELNEGWQCQNIKKVHATGIQLSQVSFSLDHWLSATVPGTVLTTLLNDKLIPDPFYGMNNTKIPDIYNVGRDFYTYWFVNDFHESYPQKDEQVYLNFRGVNYACDIFLNGHKINAQRHYGMFLRQSYNITSLLAKDEKNRLAVIVFPPDPVGNPNGGQGGDGTIAKNVAIQYPAGWDWIQPIHDRNTGIWDKVTIEKTHGILLENPHITTLVPGKRFPNSKSQEPAIIKASIDLENPSTHTIEGIVQYNIDGQIENQHVNIKPLSTVHIKFPDLTFLSPKLWWPNGYGKQPLYVVMFQFVSVNGQVLDHETIKVGIREIQTHWNNHTRSMQIAVNGQKIFIKGGDWIVSDAMLRLSPERYDVEVRFHRDMNLNLIRVWGGALTERPEFYNACDKYGLLVFQDFWFSGDCNGRWIDPMKKEDQWTRRNYPDDHALVLTSMKDQIRMLRNHPSLAFWCGGNEITPPNDVLNQLEDSILPKLDGTRYFFEYSNTDSMSYNSLGGNGDGPYGIQNPDHFWNYRTFPFNSEVGSVGMGDYASLERFIPKKDMVIPIENKIDSVWEYHKYIGYDGQIEHYGKPADLRQFCEMAQLVNYDQYRALAEGFSSHIWDWYTGFIIWKTQNPWTALRGQMYDYYLDPNAGLYGLRCGAEPFHVMCNLSNGMVMVVNNKFNPYRNIMLKIITIELDGKINPSNTQLIYVSPSSVQSFFSVEDQLEALRRHGGGFLQLQLIDEKQKNLSENLYWISASDGNYSGLTNMSTATIHFTTKLLSNQSFDVTLSNPRENPVAFFIRLSVINPKSRQRILPVFYSDNYISILPGKTKRVQISSNSSLKDGVLTVSGWNVKRQEVKVGY